MKKKYGKGLLILVIDDDRVILDALKMFLEQQGCSVLAIRDTSTNSNVAQIIALQTPPDIIISDYQLEKGLTGIDAIREVRRLFRSDIPAFILTGGSQPEDKWVEIERNNLSVLCKPASEVEILFKIEEVLSTGTERIAAAKVYN